MIKWENVTLFIITTYLTIDLLIVISKMMFTTATMTFYGMIITLLETMILYSLIERFKNIIKKEEKPTSAKIKSYSSNKTTSR